MVEELVNIMERNGAIFHDREDVSRWLRYCLFEGWIKFLKDSEGKKIGFLTYVIENTDKGKSVMITNLCILKGNEMKFRLFSLRKIFKEEVENVSKFKWHNDRRDKYIERTPIGS